jgi:hypothetical protein
MLVQTDGRTRAPDPEWSIHSRRANDRLRPTRRHFAAAEALRSCTFKDPGTSRRAKPILYNTTKLLEWRFAKDLFSADSPQNRYRESRLPLLVDSLTLSSS